MKAINEQVLAAMDGEMCAQQAEKLRIIRFHMDSLALCKANLESLILTTAEKYLPQLGLVMTAPGIQSFAAIGIISEIGVDMSVFPTSKHLCSWAGLTPQNNESAGKKKSPESVELEPTSNRCLFNVPFVLSVPGSSLQSEIATLRFKSVVDTKKQLSPSAGCYSRPSTICSRNMRTVQSRTLSQERQTIPTP